MKNVDDQQHGNPCPWAADITAWVQGEPSRHSDDAIQAHLVKCASCQDWVAELRVLRQRLDQATAPHNPSPDDLAWGQHLLQRAKSVSAGPTRSQRPRRLRRWATVSAIVVILLGAIALLHPRRAAQPQTACQQAAASASAWLEAAQSTSGAWQATMWGAHPNYEITVSSLALLAIHGAGSDENARTAQQRGIDYLKQTQHETGRFGPFFGGVIYNQSAALLALATACGNPYEDPALRTAVQQGAAVLMQWEKHDGGWGAPTETHANLAMTVWATLALQQVLEAGIEEARDPLMRGLAWLDQHAPAYRETIERGDLAHALAMTPKRLQTNPSNDIMALMARQQKTGPIAGSWEAEDSLRAVGGRIYATSLALLSLKDCAAAW